VPVVLIVALLLVVVGLGIAAVRVQRRGVPEPTSPSERAAHWSRIVSGALLVVAAILVVVGIVAGLEVWPPSLDTYPGLESLDTSGVDIAPLASYLIWAVTGGLAAALFGISWAIRSIERVRGT
jgi:Na+-transporting methylmalonyl-CoA/oxaloacetate decarboxylase gamma subunit